MTTKCITLVNVVGVYIHIQQLNFYYKYFYNMYNMNSSELPKITEKYFPASNSNIGCRYGKYFRNILKYLLLF